MFKAGMAKAGLEAGFMTMVESFWGFKFFVAAVEQEEKAGAKVSGGNREKKHCKGRASLSEELGEAGLAALRLKPAFFY
eukprot:3779067-Pleurochrysis_carterae.AAC.1